MDHSITVADDRAPLLNSATEDEILPWRSDHHRPPPPPAVDLPPNRPPDQNQRLTSLDVFRGLTVALMILVDDAGGKFPSINHAPWFGVTLADFVMPFFLFGVGISAALVFKKSFNKHTATRKVILRTIKLFLLGVLLQGGYFHGRGHLTYGVDIDHIRWLGVLQRISIGYFLAAMSEIWLVGSMPVDSPVSFVKKYYIEWLVAILLSSVYIGLLYGLYVPNWEFRVPNNNSTLSFPNYGLGTQTVQCGISGSLSPPCNAVGLIDRVVLGEKHLYKNPIYKRTKECSVNSPDYGPLPPNSPAWCLAPFDPEGILSSLMAAVTCFAGLHFGHLIMHLKSHKQRLLLWSVTSLGLTFCGLIVQAIGMPLSKPLYTLSYMLLTAGASGLVLTFIYYMVVSFSVASVISFYPGIIDEVVIWKAPAMVDVQRFRKPFLLLQWMGMNALIVFILAASELFPVAVQGFYWRSPSNNLVNATESLLQTICRSEKWGTMAFVLLEILFWCIFAGYLHRKGIYLKL